MKKTKEKLLGLGFVLVLAISVMMFASVVTVAAQLPPGINVTDPSIYLTAEPTNILADGSSTSIITATVWDGKDWIAGGFVVNFSTSLGEITASAPLENETATAILTAGAVEGIATITAEVYLDEDLGILHNTTTVNLTTSGDGGDDNGGDNGGGGNGGGGDGGATTPTPTPTGTPSETVTPTPTAGATATPTASPAETGTPTATESPMPSPSPTKKPLFPGFEAVFAIAGLLTVAYLVMRRRKA